MLQGRQTTWWRHHGRRRRRRSPGALALSFADRSWICYTLFPLVQLVLINISDHHTRTLANQGAPAGEASTSAAGGGGGGPCVRVLGCLLGSQSGRTVS